MAYPRKVYRRRTGGVSRKKLPRLVRGIVERSAETKASTVTTFSSVPVETNWQFTSFLGSVDVEQGVNDTQRIGDTIKVQKIEFMVYISPITAEMEGSGTNCRFVVYHNNRCQGVYPDQTGPNRMFNSEHWLSHQFQPREDQYKILLDHVHNMTITQMTSVGVPEAGGPCFAKKFTIYPKTIIRYSGGGGTLAELISHDYGVAYAGDGSQCCAIAVIPKVFYTDV